MIHNKLVRDKIPEIIKASWEEAVIEVLSEGKYIEELRKKLQEEVSEFLSSDDSIEEIADIVEVIYAILDSKWIKKEEFEKIRSEKFQKRWWFQKRIFLKETN